MRIRIQSFLNDCSGSGSIKSTDPDLEPRFNLAFGELQKYYKNIYLVRIILPQT